MNIDREHLAWAAGFFDGEGTTCTAVRTGRTYFRVRDGAQSVYPQRGIVMAVSQAGQYGPELLYRFQLAVGRGKVHNMTTRIGNAQSYAWRTAKFTDVQAVVALLWTWLGPAKRLQAEIALREYNEWPRQPRPQMTSERGQEMARKRWTSHIPSIPLTDLA